MIGRRLAAAAAISLASLSSLALPAVAQEEAPDPDWEGSVLTTPSTTGSSHPDLTADFVRSYGTTNPPTRRVVATTDVTAPGTLPAGCTSSIGVTTVTKTGTNHATTAQLSTSCNGTYGFEVEATLQIRNCVPALGCDSWVDYDGRTLTGTIDVAAPPPAVSGASADPGSGRSVVVSWSPVSSPTPDFLGYRVERASSEGTTTTLATIDDPATGSFTDDDPPAEGGPTTYTVYARRSSSRGEVSSTPASASTDVLPVGSGGDTDGTTDGGSGGTGGTGGGTGGTGGGTGGTGGSTGGGTGSINSGGRPSGTIKVPRVGTPSRNFFPPLLAPPADTGFSEELPFGDREPGEQDAALPDDELASGPLSERLPGRGLVVPVATGLVLAVWALHLRFLARAAQPEYVDDQRIEILSR